MTGRIENLIAAGRLERLEAADQEVVGLWANALKAFGDALLADQSHRGRLTEIEYGDVVNAREVDKATSLVRQILEEGARHLRAEREAIKRRIRPPK